MNIDYHENIKKFLENPNVLEDEKVLNFWIEAIQNLTSRLMLKQALGSQRGVSLEDLAAIIKHYRDAEFFPPPQRINAFDLIQEPDDDKEGWVFEGFIPATGLTLVAGPPKSNKSTAVRQMAYCVANAEDFLAYPIHRPGPVLWISGDESKNDLKTALRKAYGDEPTKHAIEVVYGWFKPEDFFDLLLEHYQAMTDEAKKPVMIVLDTLSHGIDVDDLNAYSKMSGPLGRLGSLSEKLKVAIVLITHTRKQSKWNGGRFYMGFDDILGTQRIRGSMSACILLYKPYPKDDGIIHFAKEGRNMPTHSEVPLVVDWDKAQVDYASDDRVMAAAPVKDEDGAVAKVYAALVKEAENAANLPTTRDGIKKLAGVSSSNASRAIQALKEEGQLEIEGKPKTAYLLMPDDTWYPSVPPSLSTAALQS